MWWSDVCFQLHFMSTFTIKSDIKCLFFFSSRRQDGNGRENHISIWHWSESLRTIVTLLGMTEISGSAFYAHFRYPLFSTPPMNSTRWGCIWTTFSRVEAFDSICLVQYQFELFCYWILFFVIVLGNSI